MATKRMTLFDFVVSDMDGTLLASTHRLSDVTGHTLLMLMQRHHIPVILATGRSYADVHVVNDNLQRYFAECHMSPQDLAPTYLITSNGAVVHDAATRRVVSMRCLPVELVRTLYSIVPESETRINTNFYQHERWFARYDWPWMLQFHAESGLRYEVLPCLPEATKDDAAMADNKNAEHDASAAKGDLTGVSMFFFCAGDVQLLEQLERQLLARFGNIASIGFSAVYCLNVTAKDVNKADGLRAVFAALPRQRHEQDGLEGQAAATLIDDRMRRTVAFGDQVNDYELLTQVGKGCIVANCSPRLREMCPQLEVIASNDDDGPAHKLCELFDLPLPQA